MVTVYMSFPQELQEIEGHEVLTSPDSIQFDILVRKGSEFVIRDDLDQQWAASSKADLYKVLAARHNTSHAKLLSQLVQNQASATTPGMSGPVPTITPDPDPANARNLVTMTALEPDIVHRTISEVTGVELLRDKQGNSWMVSETSRIIPKHTVIAGVGTGQPRGSIRTEAALDS